MKLTIERTALKTAVDVANQAVAKKYTLFVTSCLLLEADARTGVLTVTGTDLEIRMSRAASATIEKPGACCVAASTFAALVAGLSDGLVRLEMVGSQLQITSGVARAKLSTVSADDYPPAAQLLDDPDAVTRLTVDGSALTAASGRVSYAAATNKNRPVLTGILWQIKPGELAMAAADGFRLAVVRLPAETQSTKDVIVPARAMGMIEKIAKADECDVAIARGWLILTAGETTLRTTLLEGSFPNYQQLIPQDGKCILSLSARELAAALDFIEPLAGGRSDNGMSYRSLLVLAEDGLHVLAPKTQDGDAETMIAAMPSSNERPYLAIERGYLLDAVRSLPNDRALIAWTSQSGPLRLTADADDTYVHVIMPLFINDWPAIMARIAERVAT